MTVRIIGYKAEVRSKYNHALFNITEIKQTESAAKRRGQVLLERERFPSELYIEVVKVEEHIL